MPTKPFRELLEKMPAHRPRNVARRVQETLAAMPLHELRKARRVRRGRAGHGVARTVPPVRF